MQTAVQKIIEQIDEEVQVLSNLYGSEIKGRLIALAFAKKRCLEVIEMEKQQIIDAFGIGCHHESKRLVGYQDIAEQYYNETYGSKGSDVTSSQTEISDSTITDQIDGIIFELPFDDKIKLWKLIEKLVEENRTEISDKTWLSIDGRKLMANKPTEISDEDIEKGAKEWYEKEGHYKPSAIALKTWVYAIRWYREQLKQRQ